MTRLRPWVPISAALGLFLVWSNTFIVIGYLLGSDGGERRFDWVGLTAARFMVAAVICAVYCLCFRRAESIALFRERWRRLLVCTFLMVPGYNLSLYYAQQHGVAAPIASLTTALVPLLVMAMAAIFLGERLKKRRLIGFAIAAAGMVIISLARLDVAGAHYPALIAITMMAPLSWSIYSVVSKPVAGKVSPVLWTFVAVVMGGVLMLPLVPGSTYRQWAALDAKGWAALLYLAVPATVLGFVAWNWLLRHLPASTVGFTVFLNPPLTTVSKFLLATLIPATFVFTIQTQEWVGGGVTLLGMAIAVYTRRR